MSVKPSRARDVENVAHSGRHEAALPFWTCPPPAPRSVRGWCRALCELPVHRNPVAQVGGQWFHADRPTRGEVAALFDFAILAIPPNAERPSKGQGALIRRHEPH